MGAGRHVLVLAAGKGTRMKSSRPKVLQRAAGLPLIEHVLRAAASIGPDTCTLVVGYRADDMRRALAHWRDLRFVVQEPQLGTAHAVLQAEAVLAGFRGTVVVLSGDVPLITAATLGRLLEAHETAGAAATVLTATFARPYGYGRVVRRNGRISRILEEEDASPEQRKIQEVNSGIYAFAVEPLFDGLRRIPEAGPKNERYLPAIVQLYRRQKLSVDALVAVSADEIRGVNSQFELAEVSKTMRQSKNEELMAAGVTIEDPTTTYVDVDVTVGADTVIHPGVLLEGRTTIGARCEIHSGVRVVDSTVGDDVTINNYCVILGSRIASGASIGPFAHLRPESDVGDGAHIGNFVELKKTAIGAGSKANHLTYLGDATIGARVNVGAGTITCNYDGSPTKHRTIIEDETFVGSGTELVAPVTLGRGSYVAAGSCITEDVPAGALAVARGRQVNKEGWVEKRKTRGIGGRR